MAFRISTRHPAIAAQIADFHRRPECEELAQRTYRGFQNTFLIRRFFHTQTQRKNVKLSGDGEALRQGRMRSWRSEECLQPWTCYKFIGVNLSCVKRSRGTNSLSCRLYCCEANKPECTSSPFFTSPGKDSTLLHHQFISCAQLIQSWSKKALGLHSLPL